MTTTIITHFRMRSYQRRSFEARQNGCKRFIEVLHRRAGKDRNWLNITLTEAIKTRGVYFHIFPSLNQGRRDLWDNIIQETIDGETRRFPMRDMFPPQLIDGRPNETEMQIPLVGGSLWQIMGADSEEAVSRLRGPNPIGIVFSEYAYMLPSAWDTLSPVLAENGGWVAFISTPHGKNHFHSLYESAKADTSWFSQLLTIGDTRRDALGEDGLLVIPLSEIEDLRRHGMREEKIQEDYYCSFEGYTHGTIYGDLINKARAEGRIGVVPYLSHLPVGACFDLGHQDATAIWFYQLVDEKVNFIDYVEDVQKSMHHYARLMREDRPYMYGRLVLPWDGRIAEEYLTQIGFHNVHVCDRAKSVQSEIDLVRREFSRFCFDAVKCARGIRCLEEYSRVYKEEEGVFQAQPIHDQWSHGADSLRTGVAGGFGPLHFRGAPQRDLVVETEFDPRILFGIGR